MGGATPYKIRINSRPTPPKIPFPRPRRRQGCTMAWKRVQGDAFANRRAKQYLGMQHLPWMGMGSYSRTHLNLHWTLDKAMQIIQCSFKHRNLSSPFTPRKPNTAMLPNILHPECVGPIYPRPCPSHPRPYPFQILVCCASP